MTSVLIRMGDVEERRGHREKIAMCLEGWVYKPQDAKGRWQTPESRKGKEGSSSRGVGESMALPML